MVSFYPKDSLIRLITTISRSCYVAVCLYVIGLVLIGVSFQHHLNIAVFIIGWGLAEVATMVNTVAVCAYPRPVIMIFKLIHITDAYISDCFPRLQVCHRFD